MRTHRTARLKSLIHQLVAEILQRDYGQEGSLVTIASVELNSASDHAKIFISILPSTHRDKIFSYLKKQEKKIEWTLLRKMPIRPVPSLEFVLDIGLSESAKVEKLLQDQ